MRSGRRPHGFFIGEWWDDPVGCISAVAYDDRFGFVGLYTSDRLPNGKDLIII